MKYIRLYEPRHDEAFQIEIADDDDAILLLITREQCDCLSSEPHAGLPIRARSRTEADEQRRSEQR